MTYPHQQVDLLAVLGLLLVVLVLVRLRSLLPRFVRAWIVRRGSAVLEWLTPRPEVDPVAEELRRVHRCERLSSDVLRLRHLIATDTWMSATRQLGNRLAYDWLVRELAEVRAAATPTVRASGVDRSVSWAGSAEGTGLVSPVVRSSPAASAYAPRVREVETLDIGWR